MTTVHDAESTSEWPLPQIRDLYDDLDALASLRVRLVSEADQEGLLDVAYRTFDSPVGELMLAATSRGLVRVAYLRAGDGAGARLVSGHDEILDELAAQLSPRVLAAPSRLDPVARQLDDYFSGRRESFDVPLDLTLARGFRRKVVAALAGIPYGSTASYSAVAAQVGSPKAARAVGTSCALNPLPIVLPCHRVVRGDGGMGRYAGGPAAKEALLGLEALHDAG